MGYLVSPRDNYYNPIRLFIPETGHKFSRFRQSIIARDDCMDDNFTWQLAMKGQSPY